MRNADFFTASANSNLTKRSVLSDARHANAACSNGSAMPPTPCCASCTTRHAAGYATSSCALMMSAASTPCKPVSAAQIAAAAAALAPARVDNEETASAWHDGAPKPPELDSASSNGFSSESGSEDDKSLSAPLNSASFSTAGARNLPSTTGGTCASQATHMLLWKYRRACSKTLLKVKTSPPCFRNSTKSWSWLPPVDWGLRKTRTLRLHHRPNIICALIANFWIRNFWMETAAPGSCSVKNV
mmetsp:Transcript_82450/g.229796  ORF Transcript_82450/g.229796 Transcript_82450/m.229796 type:complete len:244 (+) Transcript_82450:224-955(+)